MSKVVYDADGTQVRNCKVAFKCPQFWSELQETEDSEIRHCKDCNKNVYRCTTDEDIADAIKRDRCVAIMPYFDESAQWREGFMGAFEKA